MDRRKFLSVGGTAAGAAALAGCGETASSGGESEGAAKPEMKPMRMHVGTQRGPTNPEMLQYFKRHGINHIVGYPPRPPADRGYWLDEEVVQTREMCEKHGIELEVVALPFLSSSHIDREKRGAIMMADSPERDRDIEHIQKMIIACSKAGVRILKYNMSMLGVLRTERTPGRGGSTYSTWNLAEAKPDPPLTRAGHVNDEQAWERITYFLDRVIPAAAEYKVAMACHPHDPGAVVVADASSAWRIKGVLATAAREGARLSSMTPDLQPDDANVLEWVDAILEGSGVDVEAEATMRTVRFTSPLKIGDPVTVEVSHAFQPIVFGLVPAFSDPLPLDASSTMRYSPVGAVASP